MKLLLAVALLGVALASAGPQNSEAPTGFDNKSNGLVDDATHQADQDKFDEIEGVAEGLGRAGLGKEPTGDRQKPGPV